jgi:NADH dehydrogenase/NADH:ubiquinone oxidoreductase subunit G
MFALKELMGRLGVTNIDCRQDGAALDPRSAVQLSVQRHDRRHRAGRRLMIVGANPRKEAPVLNARIRKRWRSGNPEIGVIGEKADLTYDYAYLGAGPETLGASSSRPAKAERQIWLIGQGALARPTARRSCRWRRKAARSTARSRTAGTASRSCTPRRARRRARYRLRAGAGRQAAAEMARPARSTCCSCSAPTRSTSRRAPSSSTSARMATAARIAPT